MDRRRTITLNQSYLQTMQVNDSCRRSIGERLAELADEQPDKVAFIFRAPYKPRETLTRQQLYDEARNFGTQCIWLGIKPGDRVAVLVPLGPEWAIVQFGLYMVGATAVNSLTFDSTELKRFAANLRCRAIISGIENDQKTVELAITLMTRSGDVEDEHIMTDLKVPNVHKSLNVTFPVVSPDTVASLFFTSGSTGHPKLAAHTHLSLMTGAVNYFHSMRFKPEDVIAYDRPMMWLGGYPLMYIGGGLTMVYIRTQLDAVKDVSFYAQVMCEENPTSALIMEHRIKELQRNPNLLDNFSRLSSTMTGGQITTQDTVRALLAVSEQVIVGYGSTESGHAFSVHCSSIISDFEDGSIGYAGFSFEAKLVNPDGDTVPVGEAGELYIRGDACIKHYVFVDGEIGQALDDSGWYHTGDVAVFQKDGLAKIIGRTTEIIKRATVKIFPALLEKKLKCIADILDVRVLGIPDDKLYQEVCACIILKPSSVLSVEDIRRQAGEIFKPHLSPDGLGFMPGYFLLMDEFPKLHVSSKSNRALLVKKAEELLKQVKML